MKSLWEKENTEKPIQLFKFSTSSVNHYIKAYSFEEVEEILLIEHENDLTKAYEHTKISEEEWNKRQFFIGESGEEFEEEAWATLKELFEEEWQPEKFIKDKEPTHYLCSKNLNFPDYDGYCQLYKLSFMKKFK